MSAVLDDSSVERLQYKLGRCLVIGGSGWLGSFLVSHLLQLAEASTNFPNIAVHSADIVAPLRDLETLHSNPAITHHKVDISDRKSVLELIRKIRPNTVFHLASCIDLRSVPAPTLEKVNVLGTKNVLEECICPESFEDDDAAFNNQYSSSSVRYLVYTSSIDVVSMKYGVKNADENSPYPEKPSNDYKRTKILAEKLALSFNNSKSASKTLYTCALRPAHIFGPADRVFKIASESPIAVGHPCARMSMIYIENCARAHVLAAAGMMKENYLLDKSSRNKPSLSSSSSSAVDNASYKSAKICGSPIFVHDFDVNFCDFYTFLGGRSTSKKDPITGMSSGVLEASEFLTVNSSFAAKSINYSCSHASQFPIVDKGESVRRTLAYTSTGNIKPPDK